MRLPDCQGLSDVRASVRDEAAPMRATAAGSPVSYEWHVPQVSAAALAGEAKARPSAAAAFGDLSAWVASRRRHRALRRPPFLRAGCPTPTTLRYLVLGGQSRPSRLGRRSASWWGNICGTPEGWRAHECA